MGSLNAEVIASRGRGRGRGGRGRGTISQRTVLGDVNPPRVEDAVDGCLVRKTQESVFDFGDRYNDDTENDRIKGELKLDSGSSTVSKNEDKKKPLEMPHQHEEKDIPVKIVSVHLMEKLAQIKFIDRDVTEKFNVCVYESPLMKQWLKENHLVFHTNTLPENTLLSALEMNIGEEITVKEVRNDGPDGPEIFIDVFSNIKIRKDFFTSLIFFMVPRLPSVNLHSLGVITNLREAGEIDVIFYRQLWVGMKETLQALQIEKKLLSPSCLVVREVFKELINGFRVSFFLAPLNDNWSELHRVKVVGRVSEKDMVTVHYIDLGKFAHISVKSLAMPLPANFMPELLDQIPPQSVKLRVKNLDPKYDEALMSLRRVLEGRVCYIQTIDENTNPPLVDIVVTNSNESGTVSLSELVAASATQRTPQENEKFKPKQLITVQNQLNEMLKKWEESFLKEIQTKTECECCKNEPLGVYTTSSSKTTFPSVKQCVMSELKSKCKE